MKRHVVVLRFDHKSVKLEHICFDCPTDFRDYDRREFECQFEVLKPVLRPRGQIAEINSA